MVYESTLLEQDAEFYAFGVQFFFQIPYKWCVWIRVKFGDSDTKS